MAFRSRSGEPRDSAQALCKRGLISKDALGMFDEFLGSDSLSIVEA